MLEAKNDNKDRNDIDIEENTAGTVGFDPKTGKVFYVDEPKKTQVDEEIGAEHELRAIAGELNDTADAIIDLLKEAGIEDPTDLDAIRKLAEEDK